MKKGLILNAIITATFSKTLYAQPVIETLTPPAELRKYETQLFNLLDRTEKTSFDPNVRKSFKSLLQKAPVADPKLEKKLLSGPASKGRYVNVEGSRLFYYTACQAHWCSSTNLAMLFNPTTKEAVGVLNYRCDTYYLNIKNDSQKAWFDTLNRRQLSLEAQKKICDEAKDSKP
jgi:hypothetical protein